MAQTPPGPVVVHLAANTFWARAFIALMSAGLALGWRPRALTVSRLASFAGRLVTVRAR